MHTADRGEGAERRDRDARRSTARPTPDARQGVKPAAWSLADIPYHALERHRLHEDGILLYLLASASFIEITSDLYTRNLVKFFEDDDEVAGWLRQHWEREELQHGAALKRYVETAWPEFDWQAAYRGFFDEYSRGCALERFSETRALELVSRCVVETGTASFYGMLADFSPEPVLRLLASRIRADEIGH
ncbi:MAG: ferritin-like domain-containing protein, partial [Alphaproteobacteria bacterium]